MEKQAGACLRSLPRGLETAVGQASSGPDIQLLASIERLGRTEEGGTHGVLLPIGRQRWALPVASCVDPTAGTEHRKFGHHRSSQGSDGATGITYSNSPVGGRKLKPREGGGAEEGRQGAWGLN